MNLLSYTKKLYEKINYYDNYTKNNSKRFYSNPFYKPVNLTVIWIEDKENKKN